MPSCPGVGSVYIEANMHPGTYQRNIFNPICAGCFYFLQKLGRKRYTKIRY